MSAGRVRLGPIGSATRWALRNQQRGVGVLLVMACCVAACAYGVLA